MSELAGRLTRPPAFKQHDVAYARMFGKKYFALFSDLGTAKTFMLLRDFLASWQCGLVDGLLVIAPIGVHRQWIEDELPATTELECEATAWPDQPPMQRSGKPRIFAIYPEAFRRTKSVWLMLKRFLQSGRIGLVIDECQMIKHVRSKTTKRVRALKPYSAYRRISSGFPNPKGLIDLFTQYAFLHTGILGVTTKGQFEERYCKLGGFRGKQIVGYQNESDFAARVAPYTYTVAIEECRDMPKRTYLDFPVELTDEQRQLIDQIKKEFRVVLDRQQIDMPMALQRLTRIQQVTCGFLPKLSADDPSKVIGLRWLPELRTKALENVLDRTRGKVLIWSRFKPCIDRLTKHFGDAAVSYQGGMSTAERREALAAFMRDPKCTRMFAQPKSAGTGLNGLTIARYSFYWSNSYDAQQRQQTERRTWRLGQTQACVYGDFLAEGSFDSTIRNVLLGRQSVAKAILHDIANWKRQAPRSTAERAELQALQAFGLV